MSAQSDQSEPDRFAYLCEEVERVEAENERLRRKLEAVCRERDEAYEERAVLVGRLAFDDQEAR
jgi:hypothetical protein